MTFFYPALSMIRSIGLIVLLATGAAIAQEGFISTSTPPVTRGHFPGISQSAAGEVLTIIESQSVNNGHDMDAEWLGLATAMGFNAAIHPQTGLEDAALLDTTDILIVSSGVIDIPANRRAALLQFLRNGKSLYLQGEFVCTFASNVTFLELVDSLGGSITAGGTTSGDLQPMQVGGQLETTPNSVDSLSYYWFGCHLIPGDTLVKPFLDYQGLSYGFVFRNPQQETGTIMMTTDQDWVRLSDETNNPLLLMENILYYLLNGEVQVGIGAAPGVPPITFNLQQNYPNPFNPQTTIAFTLQRAGTVTLKVFDISGREIAELASGYQVAGDYSLPFEAADLSSGVYFYRLQIDGQSQTRKMLLAR